jgi:hypothetical protein
VVPKLKPEPKDDLDDILFNLSLSGRKPSKVTYKLIDKDLANSKSTLNPVNQRCYKRDKERYGEHHSYSISFDGNKNVKLIPNHKLPSKVLANGDFFKSSLLPSIDPINGRYIFVIVPVKDNDPQLRVAKGCHFLVANEADQVYAAGEINFFNKKISFINDKSGAYFVRADNPDFYAYRESFKRVLQFFGLPINVFFPIIENPEDSLANRIGMSAR